MHTDRVSRVEHKFLMWLNANCRYRSSSLSYADLLKHFKLTAVSARHIQHDIMFIRNVLRGKISSTLLLRAFSLRVPLRSTRQQATTLLYVPFARVNVVKSGLFVRSPKHLNLFLDALPTADMFSDSFHAFRAKVKQFVATL